MAKNYATKRAAEWLNAEIELLDLEKPFAGNTGLLINAKLGAPLIGQGMRVAPDASIPVETYHREPIRSSGKSHLIRYIMHENQQKFDWGLVFSNMGFSASNFDYIDKRFVHAKYDESALANLKSIHEQLVEKGKKPSGFVIFDDCLFGDQWRSKEFLSLMTQLRHYGITCIISCQYPQAIPPVFRSNAFQVAMFNMTTKPALEALFNSYGQMFDSYSDFKKFLLEKTEDHQFIWYDARNGARTIDGRYQVMNCPAEIPYFKIEPRTKID